MIHLFLRISVRSVADQAVVVVQRLQFVSSVLLRFNQTLLHDAYATKRSVGQNTL